MYGYAFSNDLVGYGKVILGMVWETPQRHLTPLTPLPEGTFNFLGESSIFEEIVGNFFITSNPQQITLWYFTVMLMSSKGN